MHVNGLPASTLSKGAIIYEDTMCEQRAEFGVLTSSLLCGESTSGELHVILGPATPAKASLPHVGGVTTDIFPPILPTIRE
nr:hypothetical protein CFP56_52238 [Quercus suber]